jgi:hypothetical protein
VQRKLRQTERKIQAISDAIAKKELAVEAGRLVLQLNGSWRDYRAGRLEGYLRALASALGVVVGGVNR